MTTTFIYGLCDPRTGALRYVGKSKNWKQRSYEHVCASHLRRKCHKNHWIKSLLAEGYKPDAFLIEEVPSSQWEDAEREWIAYFRSIGADLTNSTSGGDGAHDLPADVRAKIGNACRGVKKPFSQEHKDKIAAANRARAKDPVWLAAARRNLAANRNLKGRRWTPESKATFVEMRKRKFAAMTPQQRTAFAMLGVAARKAA